MMPIIGRAAWRGVVPDATPRSSFSFYARKGLGDFITTEVAPKSVVRQLWIRSQRVVRSRPTIRVEEGDKRGERARVSPLAFDDR